MNKLLKIDNIMFFVENLDASAKFYEDVLGLKRGWTDEEKGMIGFVFPDNSCGEIVIHNDATLPRMDYSFLVENVEEFCTDFRQQGYEIQFGPIEVRCGNFAILSDLDGNRIPVIDLTKFGGKPQYDR